MSMRLRRLASDYEAMRDLTRRHPRVRVEGVSGNPPERYRLILDVRSLRERGERIVAVASHRLEITLPSGYPRDAPICRMLTPVFHPNIAPHAVCIGDHWTAAESLDLMVQRVGEMLAYQSYNVKSPLNGRAARWVEEHPHLVPVDREPFFVDLHDAPPRDAAEGACSNCASTGRRLVPCGAGHVLCPECDLSCGACGAVLCLACGRTACAACEAADAARAAAPVGAAQLVCTNCARVGAQATGCAAGHAACADCALACAACGAAGCLACVALHCANCGGTLV